MKKLGILLIVIICIALFFIIRKHYAVSDARLLEYHWKYYDLNCKSDGLVLNKDDLNKIGKEWKLTYRWADNAVFLHLADCVYIAK